MATNLRLRPELEDALRAEAERTGRSQQAVIRDSIELHLGMRRGAQGLPQPRVPYRRPTHRLVLAVPSSSLLDRDDRLGGEE